MLRDIILFGVSVGVLCLYFAFLLYEWFLNKKKMRAETDKTYNFILPAAKRILSILQNRLYMELKEETLKRYRKLYVGKSDDDIKRDYYIKHISVFLYIKIPIYVLCNNPVLYHHHFFQHTIFCIFLRFLPLTPYKVYSAKYLKSFLPPVV